MVCSLVSAKLGRSQIQVGPASTCYHGGGCNKQAIAAAEQQAHGCVGCVIAKRESDARGRVPVPVLLLLWNGIKMRIALL